MDDKNCFGISLAQGGIPKTIEALWEPLTWCAIHKDRMPKIMGQIPCGKKEREEIIEFLIKEEKYELAMAIAFCNREEMRRENAPPDGKPEEAPLPKADESYVTLAQWQFLAFLRWCGKKDFLSVLGKTPPFDLLRFFYIALALGYKNLALLLLARMTDPEIEEGFAALKKYGKKQPVLFKKWILDFYQNQPQGKAKKKLAKRLVRYAGPLLAHHRGTARRPLDLRPPAR